MRFIFFCTFLFVSSLSHAAPNNKAKCEPLLNRTKPDQRLCVCEDSLAKLSINIPANFKLKWGCNVQEDLLPLSYGFEGDVEVTGVIKESLRGSVDDEGGGWELTFSADAKNERALKGMQFQNDETALKVFKAPKLTKRPSCLAAPVTVKISKIIVDRSDTDSGGTFLDKFEVVSIGKYVPCKTPF